MELHALLLQCTLGTAYHPILVDNAEELRLRVFPQAINGLKVLRYCLGVAAASIFYLTKNISGGFIFNHNFVKQQPGHLFFIVISLV